MMFGLVEPCAPGVELEVKVDRDNRQRCMGNWKFRIDVDGPGQMPGCALEYLLLAGVTFLEARHEFVKSAWVAAIPVARVEASEEGAAVAIRQLAAPTRLGHRRRLSSRSRACLKMQLSRPSRRRVARKLAIALLVSGCSLAACTVRPSHDRPEMDPFLPYT